MPPINLFHLTDFSRVEPSSIPTPQPAPVAGGFGDHLQRASQQSSEPSPAESPPPRLPEDASRREETKPTPPDEADAPVTGEHGSEEYTAGESLADDVAAPETSAETDDGDRESTVDDSSEEDAVQLSEQAQQAGGLAEQADLSLLGSADGEANGQAAFLSGEAGGGDGQGGTQHAAGGAEDALSGQSVPFAADDDQQGPEGTERRNPSGEADSSGSASSAPAEVDAPATLPRQASQGDRESPVDGGAIRSNADAQNAGLHINTSLTQREGGDADGSSAGRGRPRQRASAKEAGVQTAAFATDQTPSSTEVNSPAAAGPIARTDANSENEPRLRVNLGQPDVGASAGDRADAGDRATSAPPASGAADPAGRGSLRPGPHAPPGALTNSDAGGVDRARFIQRVAGAFQAAGERGGAIRLRLHPPELGVLRLEVTVRDGLMTARLETETHTARNLLLENVQTLRERLAEQDIKIDKFNVDLADRRQQHLPDRPAQDDPRQTGDSPRRHSSGRGDDGSDAQRRNPSSSAAAQTGDSGQLNVVI